MNVSPNVYAGPDALTPYGGVDRTGALRRLAPPWALFAPLGRHPVRRYPRLTAPNRGKTRLNPPNRAKNFQARSRASIRGCASDFATTPQRTASVCTNSHLLARLAPTCTEKNSCQGIAFVVPPSGGLRRFVASPPNRTRNPNLNLSANLNTFSNQSTPNVANCRRSKIRTKTYTPNLNTGTLTVGLVGPAPLVPGEPNLNTRSAGLPTGNLRGIPASLGNLDTCLSQTLTVTATPLQHPRQSLHHVAPCCSVLHRVASEISSRSNLNTGSQSGQSSAFCTFNYLQILVFSVPECVERPVGHFRALRRGGHHAKVFECVRWIRSRKYFEKVLARIWAVLSSAQVDNESG